MYAATFNLRVDEIGAGLSGDHRFPASIVSGLGIEYEWSEIQPLGESIIFRGCSNMPPRLPAYVTQVG